MRNQNNRVMEFLPGCNILFYFCLGWEFNSNTRLEHKKAITEVNIEIQSEEGRWQIN
jgi:hypothetical protein